VADPQRIKTRLEQLKALRQPHELVWRDCYDYSYPERGSGFQSNPYLDAASVQQRKAQNLDSTAPDSLRLLASSILSGLCPPNARWFALDVGQESHEERTWLDAVGDVIFENIHASNFDAEAYDAMLDLGAAGWPVLFIAEGVDSGYAFECWPNSECYIASSKGPGGRADTVYREFEYEVAQAVKVYGIDNVSPKVAELFRADKLREKVQLCMAIEPREDYAEDSPFARDMAFASCTIECATGHLVRESGFPEFPCAVPRWTRLPGSAYATGPMSQALPDVKTLNRVIELEFAGAETAIAPPMVVAEDGALNPKNIKIGPKKVIVATDVDSIKPLVTGARIDFSQLMISRIQASIRKVLFADQLQPLTAAEASERPPAMTATEVHTRVMLIRQLLGPVYGRLQGEFLQPLIERCFGILMRANAAAGAGIVGSVPQSLANRNFTVRYLSPLARAQKMEEVTGIQQFEASLVNKARIDASVLDVYDVEAAARHESELLGVPSKLIRDDRKTQLLRKAHQQAAAQQQQRDVQLAALGIKPQPQGA